mgnify:CR=1 FL=1
MDGIGKTSSVRKDDARNKYLKTMKYSPRASVIDAVQPVRPASNQLNSQRPTFMFNVDVMTRHLEDFQNAYHNLAEQEKRNQDVMIRYLKDPDEFMGLIKELVKQFNQTTACLLTFDRAFHTHHSDVIGDLLARRQFNLEPAGLRIVGINQLEFDGHLFHQGVRINPRFFDMLFHPAIQLIYEAFKYIGGIRIPEERETPSEHRATTAASKTNAAEGVTNPTNAHINQKI